MRATYGKELVADTPRGSWSRKCRTHPQHQCQHGRRRAKKDRCSSRAWTFVETRTRFCTDGVADLEELPAAGSMTDRSEHGSAKREMVAARSHDDVSMAAKFSLQVRRGGGGSERNNSSDTPISSEPTRNVGLMAKCLSAIDRDRMSDTTAVSAGTSSRTSRRTVIAASDR